MELTLRQAGGSELRQIKRLYRKSFPAEERAPFYVLRRKARQGKAQMLAARDGETFVGFVYLLRGADLAYLFYFAVDESYRGRGYGGAILRELRSQLGETRLFLACEALDKTAENYDQRCRRHAFYLRCGFQDLPCRIQEASVVYSVMGTGGGVSPREYDDLISHWMGGLARRFIVMRMTP